MPENTPEYSGVLIVQTSIAGGALPLLGATVTVSDGGGGLITEPISVQSGASGLTEAIILPAPSPLLSQTPSSTVRPYALYNLSVTRDGYYPFTAEKIPIFAGVRSIQPVNMIPVAPYERDSMRPSSGRTVTDSENTTL